MMEYIKSQPYPWSKAALQGGAFHLLLTRHDRLRSLQPPTTLNISLDTMLCRRLLQFITIVNCVHRGCAQTCFFPDGTVASLYKPCGGPTKSCCFYSDPNHHDPCYSNGYCYSWWYGSLYRGACTDSSWSASSACPTKCFAC